MQRKPYVFAALLVVIFLSGCNRKIGTTLVKEDGSPTAKASSESPISPSSEPVREGSAGKVPGAVHGQLKDVFFDFDRAALREDSRAAIEESARLLKSKPGLKVKIEGHADERGAIEYNLALGNRRAETVRRYLIGLGIEPARVSVISYGKEKPFCSDQSEVCYQQNRRGHFVSLDLGS